MRREAVPFWDNELLRDGQPTAFVFARTGADRGCGCSGRVGWMAAGVGDERDV